MANKVFWQYARIQARKFAFRHLRPRVLLPLRKLLHHPKKLSYPGDFFLTLGTTNTCNARCVFCAYPQASDAGQLTRGLMPLEMSEEAFRQWSQTGQEWVGIQPIVGDPLLDKHLVERIGQAHKYGLKVTSNTNGILLTHNSLFKALVDVGWDAVVISLGGTTRQWYKNVYQVDKYQEVIDGIEALLRYNKLKGEPCKILIGFRNAQPTLDILNSHDYNNRIKPYLSKRVGIEWNPDFVNWGGWINKLHMQGEMKFRKLPPFMRRPCEGLRVMYLRWNGNIRSCGCAFIKNEDDEMVTGKFPEMCLREIAESQATQDLMDAFNGDGSKRPEVCKTCTNYTPIYNRRFKV